MLGSGTVARMPEAGQLPQGTTQLATLGIWQITTIALTLAASAMFGGRIGDVLALGRPVGAPFVYLRAIALMAALQIGVSIVQYSFFPQDMYADLRPFVRLFGEQWVLALLVVGVGAPLSEELLFRGFLQSALARSRIGFWPGALITTGLWTALARRLFHGRHCRGVPDRPLLLLAALAHRQLARRHLLPCALQLSYRAGAQVCAPADLRGWEPAQITLSNQHAAISRSDAPSRDGAVSGKVRIAFVVAVAENGVIGRDGKLPWRLPSDLKWFRKVTLGKPVIMGRKTYESIGKPLDGRDNVVVTRQRDFAAAGVPGCALGRGGHRPWPAAGRPSAG